MLFNNLTPNSPYNQAYTWDFGDGTVITLSVNTPICADTLKKINYIYVDACPVNIAEKNKTIDNQVQIYPNPFTSETSIALDPYANENAQITITDIQGKILEKYQSNNKKNLIIGSNLNNGLYIVTISTLNAAQSLKMIKLP